MIRILDLGCGNKKRPGAVGVDFNDRTAADIVHDLNKLPYPLDDSSFDEIYLDNTLEHLVDVLRVMEEVDRVSCMADWLRSLCHISVPHGPALILPIAIALRLTHLAILTPPTQFANVMITRGLILRENCL